MPRAEIAGIDIYYEERGEGSPLVFLGGLAQETRAWRPQVSFFSARGFRVIAYDTRGQGGSDRPERPDDYTIRHHLSDLFGLFDHLGVDRADLVGLSHGGMIAQSAAIEAPERVSYLVLADTSAYVGRLLKEIFIGWIRALESGGGSLYFDVSLPWVLSERFIESNLPLIETLREQSKKLAVEPLIHLIQANSDFDLRERIATIGSRTLVLCGEEDRLTPPSCSKFLLEKIRTSELILFPGVGHCPPLETPDAFNRTVLEFLRAPGKPY
jgi:pimeloyl-ACP methyl ester carboxylesterase